MRRGTGFKPSSTAGTARSSVIPDSIRLRKGMSPGQPAKGVLVSIPPLEHGNDLVLHLFDAFKNMIRHLLS